MAYQVRNPEYQPAQIAKVSKVIGWLGIVTVTLWSVLLLLLGSY